MQTFVNCYLFIEIYSNHMIYSLPTTRKLSQNYT